MFKLISNKLLSLDKSQIKLLINRYIKLFIFFISTLSYWPLFIIGLPIIIAKIILETGMNYTFSFISVLVLIFIFGRRIVSNSIDSNAPILEKFTEKYSKKIFWTGIVFSIISIFIINPAIEIIKNPEQNLVAVIMWQIVSAPFIIFLLFGIIFFYKMSYKYTIMLVNKINEADQIIEVNK